jgi:restriction endonuclease S subunit
MKKYTYKDSGVEWLGNIPKHWKVDRIKDKTTSVVGGDWGNDIDSEADGDYIVVLRVADLDGIYFQYNDLTIRKIKEGSFKSRKITNRTLIVEKSGGGEKQLVGRVGFPKGIDFDAICSNFMAKIEFDNTIDLRFVNYLFSNLYKSNLNFPFVQQTTGIQNLNVTYYLTTRVVFPPLQEQKAIANYLDLACKRIDRIIAIKEEQLEKIEGYLIERITQFVKYGYSSCKKTTNCLWIPEINSDWEIKPLKRLLDEKLKYGANEAAEHENHEEPRYIRITDFGNDGKLKDDTFKSLSPDVAAPYLLKDGDVLFARSGATVGKTFIFKDYNGIACFAGYLIKANCNRHKLNPEYLYYFTKSKCYEEWKDLIFTQATIQNIGADKYQYLQITVPPLKEQNRIVINIKEINNKVEKLQANIINQIDTLKSYRKSLIHECVTGKKQVV